MCCFMQLPSSHPNQVLEESINQLGPQQLTIPTLLTHQSKSENHSSRCHLFDTNQGTLGM